MMRIHLSDHVALLRLAMLLLAVLLLLLPSSSSAKLPDPTPEQARTAAEKKTQTDAQAEEDKKKLAEKMAEVSDNWRTRAGKEGWKTHPPAAVKAAQGTDASTAQSSASGQPGGKQGEAAKDFPIRSEKLGTAPPSTDVKKPESTRPVQ